MKLTNVVELRRAIGDWLGEYSWNWWVTFTFRYPKSVEGAKKTTTHFIDTIKDNTFYFLVVELQKFSSEPHIHLLVGNVDDIKARSVQNAWFKKYGFAKVCRYDSTKGARFYLSKYIAHDIVDWDFQLPLNKARNLGVNL